MQTIEVIVFFVFAIAAGMIILGYISRFDFGALQRSVTCIFLPESCKGAGPRTVSYQEFFAEASNCWRSCARGARDMNCGAYYVKTIEVTGTQFDLNALKAYFKKNNICEDCNVIIKHPPLQLPGIVELRCSDDLNSLVFNN